MSSTLRELRARLKSRAPRWLVRLYNRFVFRRPRKQNQALSRRDLFTRIYARNEWGGQPGQYCSGDGSSEDQATVYADVVNQLISAKGITSVVDLGCGDFTVGTKLQKSGLRYIGVDIVEDLVTHNQERYGTAETSFCCLDIVADALPDGELCLIRQVLQHLSNAEISCILEKVRKYRYLLITEGYPAPHVRARPNVDKPHGPDIRIYDDSGVYLDQPPFGLRNVTLVLDVESKPALVNEGERIKTFLIENGAQAPR